MEWESGGGKVVRGEGIWEGKGMQKEERGMGEGEREGESGTENREGGEET